MLYTFATAHMLQAAITGMQGFNSHAAAGLALLYANPNTKYPVSVIGLQTKHFSQGCWYTQLAAPYSILAYAMPTLQSLPCSIVTGISTMVSHTGNGTVYNGVWFTRITL